MKIRKHTIVFLFLILMLGIQAYSQQPQLKVAEMTKDDMMNMTYDDLLKLPFEDLILVANKFGMSADDLLNFFLNKDVTSASKRAEKSINSPFNNRTFTRRNREFRSNIDSRSFALGSGNDSQRKDSRKL
jgi:hypothetical protein